MSLSRLYGPSEHDVMGIFSFLSVSLSPCGIWNAIVPYRTMTTKFFFIFQKQNIYTHSTFRHLPIHETSPKYEYDGRKLLQWHSKRVIFVCVNVLAAYPVAEFEKCFFLPKSTQFHVCIDRLNSHPWEQK